MTDALAFLAEKIGAARLEEGSGREFTVQGADGPRQAVLDPHNRRVKLYGLTAGDLDAPEIRQLVVGLEQAPHLYSKLTVYALPGEPEPWIRRMFLSEGFIAGYFPEGVPAELWARYAHDERMDAPRDDRHDEIVALAAEKETQVPELPEGYRCRVAEPADADNLAELLQETFSEYPVPLGQEDLRLAMAENANHFRCVEDEQGRIVATASAELDHRRRVAEMTDCATDPDHRGQGLMAYLLWRLEKDVARLYGIRDVYTLARADEVGMNCVFSKLGYRYTGRLVNNCRMPNGWESMNIWCRLPGGGAHPAS